MWAVLAKRDYEFPDKLIDKPASQYTKKDCHKQFRFVAIFEPLIPDLACRVYSVLGHKTWNESIGARFRVMELATSVRNRPATA